MFFYCQRVHIQLPHRIGVSWLWPFFFFLNFFLALILFSVTWRVWGVPVRRLWGAPLWRLVRCPFSRSDRGSGLWEGDSEVTSHFPPVRSPGARRPRLWPSMRTPLVWPQGSFLYFPLFLSLFFFLYILSSLGGSHCAQPVLSERGVVLPTLGTECLHKPLGMCTWDICLFSTIC